MPRKPAPPAKPPTLAARLLAHRERLGWTRAELAARSGVPLRTLEQIEQGRRAADPKVSTALALARAVGVTVEELCG